MKTLYCIFIFFLTIGTGQVNTVEVYRVEKKDRIEVHASNTNIYPVTLELDLELENLAPEEELPYTTVLQQNSRRKLMDLNFTDRSKGWHYQSTYTYYMGSIYAHHNHSFAYRLPYKKGEKYLLSQGVNSAFSHKDDMRFSFDFNLPEGTRVYAARGGVVVKLEEGNDRGGGDIAMMQYSNYITIMHSDGTFADYSHLQKDGVLVEVGQNVRMGQSIGYSGSTGYATGPHLHFAVKKAVPGGGFESIPIKFSTKDGIRELEEGKVYLSY